MHRNFFTFLKRLHNDTSGVTAIEYVVIFAFTAVMAVLSWGYLSGNMGTMFDTVATNVGGSSTGSSASTSTTTSTSASNDDTSSESVASVSSGTSSSTSTGTTSS